MSQTLQANPSALVESIARTLPPGAQDDFRNLLNTVVLANLTALAPGGNLLQPGGAQAGSSAPPAGVVFSASGGNGVITISITDPSTAKPNTIWHEISYGPLVSFTKNVTTLPATTNTALTIPASGQSLFVRLRSSFDKKTWSAYQLASTSAIDAGLVEATAMSAAAAFNQTNFSVVNSQASGGSALVTISGVGGPLTAYPAVRGTTQAIRPSATVVGVPPSSEQFVGWDGNGFQLKPTLASVLADNLEPVGKVSVVSTAVPTLPVINPIISGGGIVGYDVVTGGAGASQPYTLTITDGPGSGATAGAQTIVSGVLISVAPGNAGHGYDGSTVVTPSGGSGGGNVPGGGTAVGGNGGRMTAV
jgi:hypothetical protein